MNRKQQILQKIKELQELAEKESDEGRWEPEEEKMYFKLDSYGYVCESPWRSCLESSIHDKKSNNCFPTVEMAKAKKELLDHIAEFEEPEEGENFYNILYEPLKWDLFYSYQGPICRLGYIHGDLMNKDTYQEDRAKRLELIKKVYS